MEKVAPNASDEETRQRMLDAAVECFVQLGIAKTSLTDVARVAGLSRGTVYRYFGDRQRLIDAVVEVGSQRHFAGAAAAMAEKPTLAEQVGAYAEFAVREALEHQSYERIMDGDTGLMRFVIGDPNGDFTTSVRFFEPYVLAARKRGELPRSVKVTEAAEWLARSLISISTTPTSLSFDVNDPRSVGRYVARYCVAGLLGSR